MKYICISAYAYNQPPRRKKSPPYLYSMWSNLPLDLLSIIFSFLSPDSLARAKSCCKNWQTCVNSYPIVSKTHQKSWFLALPIHNYHNNPFCYAQNPITNNWHQISLQFLPLPNPTSLKPISSIGSLLLLKLTNSTSLQFALCNPFTRQFKYLPRLLVSRTNPAAGVVLNVASCSGTPKSLNHVDHVEVVFPSFRIYMVGGMSEAKQGGGGGAMYEQIVEMYDSEIDTWKIVGSVPVEFAVRLTVWTPNENVCIEETRTKTRTRTRTRTTTLYWATSARAYSVMGFEVEGNSWREICVPMVERLEFATLVKRNRKLGLVGGTCGGSVCVWVMSEEDKWCLVDEMPVELGLRLLSGKRNWECVKCVGNEDTICLYRELGSGMVVCRYFGGVSRWQWIWVDGCGFIKGKQVLNRPIRGTLVHPTLASSLLF